MKKLLLFLMGILLVVGTGKIALAEKSDDGKLPKGIISEVKEEVSDINRLTGTAAGITVLTMELQNHFQASQATINRLEACKFGYGEMTLLFDIEKVSGKELNTLLGTHCVSAPPVLTMPPGMTPPPVPTLPPGMTPPPVPTLPPGMAPPPVGMTVPAPVPSPTVMGAPMTTDELLKTAEKLDVNPGHLLHNMKKVEHDVERDLKRIGRSGHDRE